MAVRHKCTECGHELPTHWRPVATRTVQTVCPECAVKHLRAKSSRRKALASVGESRREASSAESVQ